MRPVNRATFVVERSVNHAIDSSHSTAATNQPPIVHSRSASRTTPRPSIFITAGNLS